MSRRSILSVITFSSFILITLIVILLAQGYRLDRQTNTIYGTGILVATSDPTGATLTLNDEIRGLTNTTINNLVPGDYTITITKDGYFPWKNKVKIEKSKVLTVEALMIPVNPSLSPITSTPAQNTWLSPDGEKLAYSVPDGSSAGVWMLDLSSQPFNLARKPLQLVADTDIIHYSQGKLRWSPSSKDLLISTAVNEVDSNFLLSIDNPLKVAQIDPNSSQLLSQWDVEGLNNAQELQSNFNDQAKELIAAHSDTLSWSPDNLKFTYFTEQDDSRTYYVYDKETKKHSKMLEVKKELFTQIRWYADSQHFLVLEKDSLDDPVGTVSLIDMDGTNKQQVFRGTLIGDVLYTYLSGAKLIILTSFNIQEQMYYLYSINLR
jgi:hypothetical protein